MAPRTKPNRTSLEIAQDAFRGAKEQERKIETGIAVCKAEQDLALTKVRLHGGEAAAQALLAEYGEGDDVLTDED